MDKNIICIGQTVLDVLIKGVDLQKEIINESRRADKVSLSIGGDCTNQSIVLSRLGFNSKIMGSIGSDSAGLFVKSLITKTDVNIENLVFLNHTETPVSVVIIDSQGERSFIFSGMRILTTDLIKPNLEAIKGNQVVSLGSMFASPLYSRDNIEGVLKTAKTNGAVVCADIIVRPGQNRLAEMGNVLSLIDFLFPNEDEARMFTGKDSLEEMADVILSYGVKHAVIKRGSHGVFLKSSQVSITMPAYKVNPVDTTGAGDNFVAGFITALVDEKPLDQCCKFACATAAVSILSLGANSGVQSKDQVLKFIAEHENE